MDSDQKIGGLPAERWIGRRVLRNLPKRIRNTHSCRLISIHGDSALVKPKGHRRIEEVELDSLRPWWSQNEDLKQKRDRQVEYVIWDKQNDQWWGGKAHRWLDGYDPNRVQTYTLDGVRKAAGKVAPKGKRNSIVILTESEARKQVGLEETEPTPEQVEEALESTVSDLSSDTVLDNESITLSRDDLVDTEFINLLHELAKASRQLKEAQDMFQVAEQEYDHARKKLEDYRK